ncbi:SusC/RagA family TonB-linked outer membrane protein [Mangrovibacterium lignilyticum]|uniref:SusC/RagA family TonB-linked outer membrane protein n=1 Tax=Mangrovibacterium lignilyticum TaxID=2668052 RepID=UPI0019674337|nr:SusC/RagA family TonB-linked outer membrane protein [Mangrovibacterium lignilyticum]
MKKNLTFDRCEFLRLVRKGIIIMKLTLFLVLVAVLYSSAAVSQAKRFNLVDRNATVREVLNQIEKESDYRFFYENDKLALDSKLNREFNGRSIDEILSQLSEIGSFSYKIMDNNFIVLKPAEFISNMSVLAQQQKVWGKVTDTAGNPLPGVTIAVKGTMNGTITDFDGNYTISNIPADAVLTFSFVGMKSQEITLDGRVEINVSLEEEAIGLGEVVAIGYGTQTKRNMTGSIQNVSAEELTDMPVPQVAQKLQGKLAGVQITQTTGIPGQGMTVRVRGQASITAGNSPLYVVDGTPIVGDLNNINPNEIESISVLKDAASTSLYGSRAANGVVLITTKRGKAGKTSVTFNAYYGAQVLPNKGRPDMMNAREFAQFEKELAIENGREVDPAYQNPEQYGEGTDWYDILFRVAPVQNYNLSITGGTEKFKTAAVVDYYDMDGIMLNSNYRRFSSRINTDFQINDKLKAVVNIAPSFSINKTPQSDGVWWTVPSIIQGAILTTPLAPYKNDDGTIPLTASGPGLFPNPNWYNVLQVVENETKTSRLIANGYLEYELIKNLFVKSNLSAELSDEQFFNFTPSTAGSLFNPPPQIPKATQNIMKYYTWMFENTATYSKTIQDHSFDMLIGGTAQKYHADITSTLASNFPDDQIKTLNAATSTLTTSDIQEWTLLSGIARLNYAYKDKYLISAAIRADGSSRFGSENKWGYFPSISAGWIASDEAFFPKIEAVNFMKIRASYGITGNNNIGNYTHYASVGNLTGVNGEGQSKTINYVFNNTLSSARIGTTLGNPDLGWEQTKQVDLGFELGLFKNRVYFTYDYYHKNTSDLLYQVDVPLASGYPNLITNIGELEFWGHEFSVNTKNTTGKLKWDTDLNISFNDNKVIKLGTADAPIYGDFSVTEVGERLGQFYGYIMEGVYVDQDDFDNSPKQVTSTVGSAKMKDVNGDGSITADDRTVIGNPLPVFLFGITNSFKYKNFDLSIVMSGTYGNDIAYMTQEFTTNLDGVFNVEKEVANRWKSPEDPGNGKYGTTKAGATGLNRSFNTTYVYDGSYLTVKNITLGYNLTFRNSKFASSARIYGSIQQALVISGYKGGNPEVATTRGGGTADALSLGIDHSTYPVPRTFTIGVNVNF